MYFRLELERFLASRCIGTKPTTRRFYSFVSALILEHWDSLEMPVNEITPEHVFAFANRVSHYSASYWNGMVSILRFITPHGKLLKRRPVRIREFVPPTAEQWQRLLSELDKSRNPKAGLIVRFLALTGMRITEARAVQWKHVFANAIQVPGAITKNGKPRLIPLLPGMAELLERLRKVSRGSHVLPKENARKAISCACKRAGIDRLTHHCFRHYFATKCVEAGVDGPTLARWLGHLDGGALVAKTYFHLSDEHSRRMAERVRIAA